MYAGVVEVLATLSNSTSEVILELCAKCICNLTCKTDLHPKMIKNKVFLTYFLFCQLNSLICTDLGYYFNDCVGAICC